MDAETGEVAVSRDAPEVKTGTQVAVPTPLQGTVVKVGAIATEEITSGGMLAIIESMKMEHVVVAPCGGTVCAVLVRAGDLVAAGDTVAIIEPGDVNQPAAESRSATALDSAAG